MGTGLGICQFKDTQNLRVPDTLLKEAEASFPVCHAPPLPHHTCNLQQLTCFALPSPASNWQG